MPKSPVFALTWRLIESYHAFQCPAGGAMLHPPGPCMRVSRSCCTKLRCTPWITTMRRLVRNQRAGRRPCRFGDGACADPPDASPAVVRRRTESGPRRPPSRAQPASGSSRRARSCRSKKWSVSFYRTNIDDGQGFTDISTFPADVRRRPWGPGRALRQLVARHAHRPRHAAAVLREPADGDAGTGGGILVELPAAFARSGPATSSATSGSAARSICCGTIDVQRGRWRAGAW